MHNEIQDSLISISLFPIKTQLVKVNDYETQQISSFMVSLDFLHMTMHKN